jgi:Protein of unknown function (DUF4232)
VLGCTRRRAGSERPGPEHHLVRLHAAAVAVLAALALGACGGSSTTTTTVTVSASSATTTASTPSTTPSTTTTVSRPISTTPRCKASGLSLSFLGGQGATGHGELGFALRNVSGTSCRTFGYPGVLFLGQSGQPLPTVSTRTTHDFFGVLPAVPIVVAPGSSFSFRLGVTHGISSPAGCTTAHGLQVIAPDDTASLRIAIPQGAYECRTATVSPVRPGNSAYP